MAGDHKKKGNPGTTKRTAKLVAHTERAHLLLAVRTAVLLAVHGVLGLVHG